MIGFMPLCALAQNEKFHIRCKPCTPDDVLDQLTNQTPLNLFFHFTGNRPVPPIWMKVKRASLDSVLTKAFKKENYEKQPIYTDGRLTGYLIVVKSPDALGVIHAKLESIKSDSIKILQPAFVFFNGMEEVSLRNTPAVVSIVNSSELSQSLSMNPIKRALQFITGVQSNALTGNLQGLSIWGRNSLHGNTAPNLNFGGLSWRGRPEDIYPENLERVTILKNSSAEALYGGTAASGVIILQPKTGDYGHHFRMNVLINTTVTERPNILYQPLLSAARFIDAQSHFVDLGYYDDGFGAPNFAIGKAAYILQLLREKKIGSAEAGIQLAQLERNDLFKEIQNKYFRKSISTQYHIGMDAGLSDYHSYTGLSWSKDPTPLTRNGINQYSVFTNHTLRSFHRKLETSLLFNYTHYDQLLNNSGTIDVSRPYDRLQDEKGNALPVTYKWSDSYIDTLGSPYQDEHYRPFEELWLADNRYAHHNISGQLSLSYGINDWLHIEALGRVSEDFSRQTNYYGPGTYRVRDSVNRAIAAGDPNYRLDQGYVVQYDTTGKTYTARVLVRYTRKDSSNFQWHGLTGAEIIDHQLLSTSEIYDRNMSMFSNGTISWKRRYLLYASVRGDGSNFAGVDAMNRWGAFWSVGYSQQLLREDTIKKKYPDQMTARASYGSDGNPGTRTANLSTILLAPSNLYRFPQSGIEKYVAPRRTWERNNILNLGVDFNFMRDPHNLEGFFWGSIDWYLKNSYHLLGRDTLPPSTGISSNEDFWSNQAAIRGWGIDLDLNSIIIKEKGFTWHTRLMMSITGDKVVAYRNQPAAPIYYVENKFPKVGKSSTPLFSYRYGGLSSDSGNPRGYLGREISTEYNALRNSDKGSLVYNGSYQPKVFGRLLNTFLIGSFTLAVSIAFELNFYLRRPSVNYDDMAASRSAGDPDYENRWIIPGDERHTNIPSIPRMPNANRNLFFLNSEGTAIRGDNARLEGLRLSYTVPSGWGSKFWKELVFYAYAENLGILWRNTRFHIDADAVGNSYHEPRPRSFSFGVRITY